MPLKPRKLKRKIENTGLNVEMVEILLNGYSFISLLDGYEGSPFKTEVDKRNTWKRLRNYLLKTYRDRTITDDDENTYPSGSRPWAFWAYDVKPGDRKPDESELEYLKRNDLLFTDEEFQAGVNRQMSRMKQNFRLRKHEIKIVEN